MSDSDTTQDAETPREIFHYGDGCWSSRGMSFVSVLYTWDGGRWEGRGTYARWTSEPGEEAEAA